MMSKKRTAVIAAATLTLGGLGFHQYATAQNEPAPPPPPGGGAPFPGGPGGGPFPPGGGRPGMMMGGFGGPSQMAVSGTAIYILRGNTVYRLNAATLRVEAQGEIPMDQGMVAPGGQGNFGGQGQQRPRVRRNVQGAP